MILLPCLRSMLTQQDNKMHSDRANTLLRQIKELKSNDATLKFKIASLEKEVRTVVCASMLMLLQLDAFKSAAAQQPKEVVQQESASTGGKRTAGHDQDAGSTSTKRHKPSEQVGCMLGLSRKCAEVRSAE